MEMYPIEEALRIRNKALKEQWKKEGLSFRIKKDMDEFYVVSKELSEQKHKKYVSYGASIKKYTPNEIMEQLSTPKEVGTFENTGSLDYYITLFEKNTGKMLCEISFSFVFDENEKGEEIANFSEGRERVKRVINHSLNYPHFTKNGLFRAWGYTNKVSLEAFYREGRKEGVCLKYDNFSGELMEALHYENDYLHGTSYIKRKESKNGKLTNIFYKLIHNYGSLISREIITEKEAIRIMKEKREAFLEKLGA